MTERGSKTSNAWKTQAEEGEAFCVERQDSSSVKPSLVPIHTTPNGPMTSSGSMGVKGFSRKRRETRTINRKEKSMGSTLE